MKLVASLIVHPAEHDRYFDICLDQLETFCDEIRVIVDSSDGTTTTPPARPLTDRGKHVRSALLGAQGFYSHEGKARQALLEWTLEAKPTHVLAIDADELVADPWPVREAVENDEVDVWSLVMQEVWCADEEGLCVREDGGWREHPVACLWRVPAMLDERWRIADRGLACGRVPVAVTDLERRGQAADTGTEILHFGWSNPGERRVRYDRYATHDGGRFHASQHLQSILYPPALVQLRQRPWPAELNGAKAELLGRANR